MIYLPVFLLIFAQGTHSGSQHHRHHRLHHRCSQLLLPLSSTGKTHPGSHHHHLGNLDDHLLNTKVTHSSADLKIDCRLGHFHFFDSHWGFHRMGQCQRLRYPLTCLPLTCDPSSISVAVSGCYRGNLTSSSVKDLHRLSPVLRCSSHQLILRQLTSSCRAKQILYQQPIYCYYLEYQLQQY